MNEFKKKMLEMMKKYVDFQAGEDKKQNKKVPDNTIRVGASAQISFEYFEEKGCVDVSPYVSILKIEDDKAFVKSSDGRENFIEISYLEPDTIKNAKVSEEDSDEDKLVKYYINLIRSRIEKGSSTEVEEAREEIRESLYDDDAVRMKNEIVLRRAHDKYLEFATKKNSKDFQDGKITYYTFSEEMDNVQEAAEKVKDDIFDYGIIQEMEFYRIAYQRKQEEKTKKENDKNKETKKQTETSNSLDSLFGDSFFLFDKMMTDLFGNGESKLSAKDIDDILGLNKDEEKEEDDEKSVDGLTDETGLIPFQKIIDARKKKDLPDCLIDMTELAAKGKFEDIIGREEEIATVAETLARKEIRNPLLVGKPGAGKTAVVQELVKRSLHGEIPHLKDKYFYELRMNDLVAGTMYRGQLEERLQDVMKVLEDDPNVVLFIDEIHMIVQAGSTANDKNDVANALKPYLTSDISIIGATTFDEYSSTLKDDGALARRFNTIMIEEKSKEEVVEILKIVKQRFEEFHKVELSSECVERIVDKVSTSKIDNSLIAGSLCAIDTICTKMKIHEIDEDEAFGKWEDEAVLSMDRKNNGGKTGTFGFSAMKETPNMEPSMEVPEKEETVKAELETFCIEDKMKDTLFIEQKDFDEKEDAEVKNSSYENELYSLIGDLPAGTAESIINAFFKDDFLYEEDEEDQDNGLDA